MRIISSAIFAKIRFAIMAAVAFPLFFVFTPMKNVSRIINGGEPNGSAMSACFYIRVVVSIASNVVQKELRLLVQRLVRSTSEERETR